MNQRPLVSVSIVSHLQGALVAVLLKDIATHCNMPLEVIVTLNMPEPLLFDTGDYSFPVRIVTNSERQGFGANHNAAFRVACGEHFCVLNPDIRIDANPFPPLIDLLENLSIGVAAPLIVSPMGGIEDSARRFPTPAGILAKAIFGARDPDYPIGSELLYPEWVAGMFMLFRSEVFRDSKGFDEDFFLYYEDVDLCWRLQRKGLKPVVQPAVRVVHDARRTSHRNLRYMSWHGSSMMRFFLKRALAGFRGSG
jgi:hypothetical protein